MKIEEMRALSVEELKKNREQAHQELFNLRFRVATRQLVNHREIPKARRKLARLNTIIKEKELGLR